MILSPNDEHDIWKNLHITDALFLYKLTIRRSYAKQGYSSEMINFAKKYASSHNYSYLCLHCQSKREKLKIFYQNLGFESIGEMILGNEIDRSTLYICNLNAYLTVENL